MKKQSRRKTRIISTLGPASRRIQTIKALHEAGTDVFRVNLSHGTLQQQKTLIRRGASSGAEIMIDLQGGKVRVEKTKPALPLNLARGQRIRLLNSETHSSGTGAKLWIDKRVDFTQLQKGALILLDDGKIALQVTRVHSRGLTCVVVAAGQLLAGKGVAFPPQAVPTFLLTDEDAQALADLAEETFDYVAASFVRGPKQIQAVRRQLAQIGGCAQIVAKIEDSIGVRNARAILEVADGLLVARGDLGVSMPLPELPFVQKNLVALANDMGKPVIVATQMLESMIHCQRPTRAEVTDVANAVLDGANALMLSAESAVGSFPVKAVTTMVEIVERAERAVWDRVT